MSKTTSSTSRGEDWAVNRLPPSRSSGIVQRDEIASCAPSRGTQNEPDDV
jgi:hypothetical protein